MQDVLGCTKEELTFFVTDVLQERAFRARQLWHWLWYKRVRTFDAMTTLAKDLRKKLHEKAFIQYPSIEQEQKSVDGTVKLLLRLTDGALVETVLIPSTNEKGETRVTQCISSQVGCAMACSFCSTAKMGFRRNMTTSEILGQVLIGKEYLADTNNAYPLLRNIVFMGMGEPFLNYDNVMRAISVLLDNEGLSFSHNKVTVSTCGIAKYTELFYQNSNACLALSLHATTQEVREKLMQRASAWELDTMINALAKVYIPKKYITLEYLLLAGINDSKEDAQRLGRIAKQLHAKVNILLYNGGIESMYCSPSVDEVTQFQQILWSMDVVVIVRQSRGSDIAAACGQLVARYNQWQKNP